MTNNLKSCTAIALAALTAAAPVANAKVAALGAGEGQLNIVAWPGYIERGETSPDFDWVTGFENATGCAVNVKTANTSDEMVALMNEGGFDLVTASGDASLRMIAGTLFCRSLKDRASRRILLQRRPGRQHPRRAQGHSDEKPHGSERQTA